MYSRTGTLATTWSCSDSSSVAPAYARRAFTRRGADVALRGVCTEASRTAPREQIAQRIGVDARQANQDPRVVEVVVGKVVGVRIGGQQFFALVEIHTDYQCLAVLAQARDQLAAHLERRRAVRRAFLDVVQRQRDFANVIERHREFTAASTCRPPRWRKCPAPSRRARRRVHPPAVAWPGREEERTRR